MVFPLSAGVYSVHTAHALGKHQHITRINTEHFEPRLTRLWSQEDFTKFEKDGNKKNKKFSKDGRLFA
jgi:hypothetical protein